MKSAVILISGNGSNLQAIIDAVASKRLPLDIKLVISNRKDAFGLTRAKNANIPTHYAPLKPYKDAGKSREEYDTDLAGVLKEHTPDLVILAGWMHVFTPTFFDKYTSTVINLHPALPGEFDGVDAIHRAYNASREGKIKRTGVMVHKVTPVVDHGEILGVREVPIHENDTLADLEARMHATEHVLLVDTLCSIASA
eukprot:Opistho-2@41500